MALKDYVPVNQRIESATPTDLGEIEEVSTAPPVMLTESVGYIQADITLDNGRCATGTASFDLSLEGKTAQATNPIEDCETSAVGRALAFLGYHPKAGIASREEVREAQRRSQAAPANPNGSQTDFDVNGLVDWAVEAGVSKAKLVKMAHDAYGVGSLDELTRDQAVAIVKSF